MSKKLFGVFAGVLVVGVMVAPPAVAQPLHSQPASILIFPLYSSRAMENTLITVTNTNESEIVCSSGFREGDVEAHYVYFDADCDESNTQEDLTPADTITVLARGHNPQFEKGYLLVEARDPETGRAIDYDFLIGSAIIVNSEFDFQWAYTPYAFEALISSDGPPGADNCGHLFVDPGDGSADDLAVNFDGTEYSNFPEFLYLDHFFGEGSASSVPGATFSNTLFLMSTESGTTSGTEMTLLGWNNNEERFSRGFDFDCTFCGPLSDITNAVTQANLAVDGNSDELLGVAYGWLKLFARDENHGVLGVFVHNASLSEGSRSFTAGRELQYSGTRSVDIDRSF